MLDDGNDSCISPYDDPSSDADLRLAVRLGFFLLEERGIDTVRIRQGVMEYDPLLPPGTRAMLVCRAISECGCRGPRKKSTRATLVGIDT